ncbi:haloacid dehalogenase-like hydrolase [Virgibacillus soli]|uniref:Haloacid dehalogenase-like hydrolase n=1 Tax=Paracerasibacillus soli TaxID=480284 RepID=A0ABU5CTT4_9BACI|nr:haloacid dehalogenase-like hydrolase [Virgibacillus soli]MDY0409286.1 haloacid dehalogenase-like hydrolase [Virgibacillus soli]
MKRLLDCTASDFQKMNGQDLKQSIRASEGRVMLSETMASAAPLYPGVTNAELAAAFGADLLLLNLFDVFQPSVTGCACEAHESVVQKMKELTGRPVGLNLEPVDLHAEQIEQLDEISRGRLATEESLKEAKNLGFDFVCLTGNPKTGVTNDETIVAIRKAREIFGEEGLIIAGKMHGAGVANETGSGIISEADLASFIEAGADIILMPAPGTVPGITLDTVEKYVRFVHAKGALVMLTIGTSQEGADEATIRQIALNSKMAGADIFHTGDTGFYGIAVPENIMTYSIAIRGRRHTYVRMAASVKR